MQEKIPERTILDELDTQSITFRKNEEIRHCKKITVIYKLEENKILTI